MAVVDKSNGVRRIRYGDFVHESTVHEHKIRYADLAPAMQTGADGAEVPYEPARLRLAGMEILKLLGPYVTPRFMDQVRAVVPLAIYLVLFQLLILRENIQDSMMITGGLLAAIIGLMLFLEGLGLGLMPFGEIIGNKLPRKSPLWLVLLIAMILGIGVTFAEPAIGALQSVGSIVDVTKAPYLWLILNKWPDVLVLAVGAGVGIAAVIGTLRFLRGWSLKPCIYALVIPTLLLTAYFQLDPELAVVLGLAWDCGAVTTGPVTVPLVLSLGIGIAAAAGKGKSSLSGFGIVTLASLFPILAVLLLSLYVASTVTPEEILSIARATESVGEVPWYQSSPMAEIIGGIRAIVPLVLFLFLVFKLILHENLKEGPIVVLGLVFCVLGMIVFNLGLTYGLSALGEQSGRLFKPLAYTKTFAMAAAAVIAVTVIPVLMVYLISERVLPRRLGWPQRLLLAAGGVFLPAAVLLVVPLARLAPYRWWLAVGWVVVSAILLLPQKLLPEDRNPLSRLLEALYDPAFAFVMRFRWLVLVLQWP